MAAVEAQLVDPLNLPTILDYEFSGDEVTQSKKRAFIEAIRTKATVYHAAQVARISRKTAYQWYDKDAQFAAAWEDSFEDAADVMETSTYEKALGKPDEDGAYRNGDSLLKMFWLKAHRPKYRDRVSVDVEVVRNEIQERMSQLNLRQLPVGLTQFLTPETVNRQQIPPQPALLQKEDPSESE